MDGRRCKGGLMQYQLQAKARTLDRISILLAMLMWCTAALVPQEISLPEESLHRVQTYFEQKLKSPYQAQNCESASYPKWEGLPLQKCPYSVTDKDGTTKS